MKYCAPTFAHLTVTHALLRMKICAWAFANALLRTHICAFTFARATFAHVHALKKLSKSECAKVHVQFFIAK
jgi:hypothetical protein